MRIVTTFYLHLRLNKSICVPRLGVDAISELNSDVFALSHEDVSVRPTFPAVLNALLQALLLGM